MNYFLDTNICIYALKGTYPKIEERMMPLSSSEIKIPTIVKAELLLGAKKSNQSTKTTAVLKQFLSPFDIVPFDELACETYAEIRYDLEKRGSVIGPNDLIIAAIVLANNGTLVTHNTREFRRIRNLKLDNWTH